MKTNLKNILSNSWACCAAFSLIILCVIYFGGKDDEVLRTSLMMGGVIMFILSLPVSMFALPVVGCAWYFLEMRPGSDEMLYLATTVLLLLGTGQWFWLIRFWYPTEGPVQLLGVAREV